MSIPLIDDAVSAVYPFVAGLAGSLHSVGGAAAAIVLCTVLLRLLLLPLTLAAVRGERARAALAPQVAALRDRHRSDPTRLATELSTLYRSAGTSPFAGFLPLLLQSPAFIVWYRIFTAPVIGGHANALLGYRFLGATLSARLFAHPLAFVPLLVLLAALGVVAVRRARRVAALTGTPAPRGVWTLLPFASLLGTLVMPLAAVVYLVATLSWTAVENVLLRRGLPAR
jgi:YidC/Oxa1 family membrane protein insertase